MIDFGYWIDLLRWILSIKKRTVAILWFITCSNYSQLATEGEGRFINQQVNWLLHFYALVFLHHNHEYSMCTTAEAAPICRSISSFTTSLNHEQDPQDTWTLTLKAGTPPQHEVVYPHFFNSEHWPQSWRCWFSFQLLHTQLQTSPVWAGVSSLWMTTRYDTLCPIVHKNSVYESYEQNWWQEAIPGCDTHREWVRHWAVSLKFTFPIFTWTIKHQRCQRIGNDLRPV